MPAGVNAPRSCLYRVGPFPMPSLRLLWPKPQDGFLMVWGRALQVPHQQRGLSYRRGRPNGPRRGYDRGSDVRYARSGGCPLGESRAASDTDPPDVGGRSAARGRRGTYAAASAFLRRAHCRVRVTLGMADKVRTSPDGKRKARSPLQRTGPRNLGCHSQQLNVDLTIAAGPDVSVRRDT